MRVLAAVVGLLAVTNFAWGADLPASVLPLAAPAPFSWTGLYLGANAGYASAKVTETLSGDLTGSGTATIPGGIGGAQIGYNYQIGAVVVGFEADFDGSMANKSLNGAGGNLSGTAQIPWIGTLRGRVGVAFDRVLLYATAGGGATQLYANNVTVGAIGNTSTVETHGGWTAGGGVEVGLTDNLSGRVEYLYFDTGNINVGVVAGAPPPPTVTVSGRIQESMVRAGLNLRLPVEW